MGIEMAVVEPKRQIVIPVANISGVPLGMVSILCAIEIKSLPGCCASAPTSNLSGIRVVMLITPPMELPA